MKYKKKNMSMPIGISNSALPKPIFWDPHYAISINNPPVTLVTGSPRISVKLFLV